MQQNHLFPQRNYDSNKNVSHVLIIISHIIFIITIIIIIINKRIIMSIIYCKNDYVKRLFVIVLKTFEGLEEAVSKTGLN